jgi:hypothetical protein
VAVGGSPHRRRDDRLRRSYAHVPNLQMPGVIDQFETDRLGRIYEQSWVLVNTAAREGLPTVFLEAAAHRCAILSPLDPDGFTSRFGYHAADGDLRKGLAFLLESNRWRECGERGHEHVRAVYETGRAMDAHVEVYSEALRRKGRPAAGGG